MEAVADEIDEAAFCVAQMVLILDGQAIDDLDAAVADGDDLQILAFVAEHFAGDDVGGEADVLAGGQIFLEAGDAGGKGGILRLEMIGAKDVAENGFFPAVVGNEHKRQLGDALERDGTLLVEGGAVFYQQHDVVFKQGHNIFPEGGHFVGDARCQSDVAADTFLHEVGVFFREDNVDAWMLHGKFQQHIVEKGVVDEGRRSECQAAADFFVGLVAGVLFAFAKLSEHLVVQTQHLAGGDDGALAVGSGRHVFAAALKKLHVPFILSLLEDAADILKRGAEGVGGFAGGAVFSDGQKHFQDFDLHDFPSFLWGAKMGVTGSLSPAEQAQNALAARFLLILIIKSSAQSVNKKRTL